MRPAGHPTELRARAASAARGLRILLVEDHAIVREGIRLLLQGEPDLEVVGEADTVPAALARIGRGDIDIVLLDVALPGRSGLEVLAQGRGLSPHTAFLVLSGHPEDQYALRALKAGASGYLTKESAPEELVRAIRKVGAGGRYISEATADVLAASVEAGDDDRARHHRLSDREFEVLRLIASGLTVSQIGERLHLSAKTISTYRIRILDKMGLSTNAELTHYAIKHGLVS